MTKSMYKGLEIVVCLFDEQDVVRTSLQQAPLDACIFEDYNEQDWF